MHIENNQHTFIHASFVPSTDFYDNLEIVILSISVLAISYHLRIKFTRKIQSRLIKTPKHNPIFIGRIFAYYTIIIVYLYFLITYGRTTDKFNYQENIFRLEKKKIVNIFRHVTMTGNSNNIKSFITGATLNCD